MYVLKRPEKKMRKVLQNVGFCPAKKVGKYVREGGCSSTCAIW